FFDKFARFVRVSTVFDEEIAGGLARRTSAQDQADLFTMAKVARDQKVKDAYKALREDLGVTGPIGATRSVLVNLDIDVIANKVGKGLIT
ncbi:hypothetical protein, partial [Isoptericola croceus]|uniref:hypothetical protein n=1 Tax=Isoptericola croceus TaxID=3031406 RepID=UPI0023F85DED